MHRNADPVLGDPRVSEDATEALAHVHEHRVVGTLRDHLADVTTPAEIRREIPGVLLRIGSGAAEFVLTESLMDGDTVLRFRVLTALNKLRAAGSSRPLDTKLVETVLAAEVVGHLRLYQILGSRVRREHEPAGCAGAARVDDPGGGAHLRLVKLLSPVYDLEPRYVGLQSSKRDIHDNALEFLENILKPQLRAMLLPLLDSDVTVQQRVELREPDPRHDRLHPRGGDGAPRRKRRPLAAGVRRIRHRHAAARHPHSLPGSVDRRSGSPASRNRAASEAEDDLKEFGARHAEFGASSGVRGSEFGVRNARFE